MYQSITEYSSHKKQLEKELAVITTERDLYKSSLSSNTEGKAKRVEKLEVENVDLSKKLKELELHSTRLMEKLSVEEATRAQLDAAMKEIQKELNDKKEEFVALATTTQQKYEMVRNFLFLFLYLQY